MASEKTKTQTAKANAEIQNPSKEEVAKLKEQHGELYGCYVGKAHFWFKLPDKKTYQIAQNAVTKKPRHPQTTAFNETIIYNTCLSNKHLLDDVRYYSQLELKVDSIISPFTDEVGELSA